MRFKCLVCLLLAGLAYGQTAPPATPPAAGAKAEQAAPTAPDKAPEVKVGPEDPVLTLKGFCSDATQTGDACKTVITRAQFEKLAEALQPGIETNDVALARRQRLAGTGNERKDQRRIDAETGNFHGNPLLEASITCRQPPEARASSPHGAER